ncbi:hypothetical protein Tco_0646850 [Tanacetum coccineum]
MVPFFQNTLGFTLKLRSPSNFKTIGLVQPWQTLGKIFACLTTRVTSHDQPPLQIMQIDRDKYHNLEDDAVVKNILNSGKHKDSVGIKILNWMITDEMKLTDHYRMFLRLKNVEKVEVNSSTLRQDDTQTISNTRLEPRIDKESLKVEIIAEVQPVNINEEVEESAEDDYDLKQREKGKHVVESRITPSPTTIRSPTTHSTLISSDNEKL